MSFIYKLLAENDIERIFQDASLDEKLTMHLNFKFEHGSHDLPKGWSVSEKTDEYLFYLPSIGRSSCVEFCFFTQKRFIFIDCPLMSREASFRNFPEELEEVRPTIEAKVSLAIAVNHYFSTFTSRELDRGDVEITTPLDIKNRLPTFIADNCNCDIE